MKNKIIATMAALCLLALCTAPVSAYKTSTSLFTGFSRNTPKQVAPAPLKANLSENGELLEYSFPSDIPTGFADFNDYFNAVVAVHTDSGAPFPLAPTGTIYYVSVTGSPTGNGTQANPFNTIQKGVDAATQAGDIVQVMPGIYYEHVQLHNVNIYLVGSPGNPSLTVIDGQQTGRVLATDSNVMFKFYSIKGFTIQNGKAVSGGGGGIYLRYAGGALENMVVQNNQAAQTGGGIYFSIFSGTFYPYGISLNNVTLLNNLSGLYGAGMNAEAGGNVSLNHVKVISNKDTGAAMGAGGGINLRIVTNATIKNSLFALNESNNNSSTHISPTGISLEYVDNALIMNTTIANNKEKAQSAVGAGLEMDHATNVVVMNSILWGNVVPGVPAGTYVPSQVKLRNSESQCSIAYSDIQGGLASILGVGGTNIVNWLSGNIGENVVAHNPLFVDPSNWQLGGFSIQFLSPCAQAGVMQYLIGSILYQAPTDDINGNPRPAPAGTMPDMGAYEVAPPLFTISGVVYLDESPGVLEGVQIQDKATGKIYATTDANGFYSFDKEYGWSAIVVPVKANYVFDPPERTYVNLSSSQYNQDYKAKKISLTISGHVFLANGLPLSGVTLKAEGTDGEVTTTTNSLGAYSFSKPVGWSGTIKPSKKLYSFKPKMRKYQNLQTNLLNEHYLAIHNSGIDQP